MKEPTLDPDPNHPTPGDSPRRLTFEWTLGEQRRLLADRRALSGGAASFREPPVPVAEQAGAPAPPAGPGDRDLLLRDLARLAELQVERARQSLADHRLVGEGIARWNLPRLAGHWLRSLPLHRQFQREVVTHLRIAGSWIVAYGWLRPRTPVSP
jgi:hypothetical protein